MTRPNFLIVGGMKCGTTSLHATLRQHPQVFMSKPKELHFFDRRYAMGWEWYESHFTPADNHLAWGEATPSYMYFEHSRNRIMQTLPDVRIVAILRDPVSRAYSHYWHYRERGLESASTFEEGLRREPKRLKKNLQHQTRGSYTSRGHYIDQLEALEASYGRERMHVLLLEDLIKDTAGSLEPLLGFLGVDQSLASELSLAESNVSGGWVARKQRRGELPETAAPTSPEPSFTRPPMSAETKARLSQHFRPYNDRLAVWLDKDLSHWA